MLLAPKNKLMNGGGGNVMFIHIKILKSLKSLGVGCEMLTG
jgi:hypothetical protein